MKVVAMKLFTARPHPETMSITSFPKYFAEKIKKCIRQLSLLGTAEAYLTPWVNESPLRVYLDISTYKIDQSNALIGREPLICLCSKTLRGDLFTQGERYIWVKCLYCVELLPIEESDSEDVSSYGTYYFTRVM